MPDHWLTPHRARMGGSTLTSLRLPFMGWETEHVSLGMRLVSLTFTRASIKHHLHQPHHPLRYSSLSTFDGEVIATDPAPPAVSHISDQAFNAAEPSSMSDTNGEPATRAHTISNEPSPTDFGGCVTALATAARPMSKPEDPDASSFLTLPGEIRNAVYEILFKKEEDIFLISRTESIDDVIWTPIPGVNLLASCQQVFGEAVGLLYSNNTFTILAPTHQSPTSLIRRAADWLTGNGHFSVLVRRVQFEMRCMSYWSVELDKLPLLRHIWMNSRTGLEVTFVNNTRHPYAKDWGLDSYYSDFAKASAVNQAVKFLATYTDLNIKRFARFPQRLEEITLLDGMRNGQVIFYSTLLSDRYDSSLQT